MDRHEIDDAAQVREKIGEKAFERVCQSLAYQDCEGTTQTIMHAIKEPSFGNPRQHQCYFVRRKDTDGDAPEWIGFAETSTTESTFSYYCGESPEFDTAQRALVTVCCRFYIQKDSRNKCAGTSLLCALVRDAHESGALLVVRGHEHLVRLALKTAHGFRRAPAAGTGEWGECFRGTCSAYQIVYLPPQRRNHRGRRIHLSEKVRERWAIP